MEGQWTEIISAADPRVSLFRNLKGHDARLVGRVLVEGDQQLSRFLALNLPIEQIFLEERFCNELAPYLTSARLQGANCFFATRSVMQDILGYRLHQGCFLTTPRPAEPNELRGPVVALAGINDPENVGAIARSAAAFGVKTILWDSSDPFLRRSVRVSLGSVFHLGVKQILDQRHWFSTFERYAGPLIVVENAPQAEVLPELLPQEAIYLFGNERTGVSEEILRRADRIVQIPMTTAAVTSLNVAASAAIVLSRMWKTAAGQSPASNVC